MTKRDKKVWFITGAGRGMGVDIAKAAFAEQKVQDLQQQINAFRDLSTSLALNEAEAAENER